ncbi:hypothetical protein POF45_01275 [Pseudomonas sp. 681]|uniref:Lipoprotein n=1 Tax=Pseudomonas fungipugnans TaxID=3024217 RepID=A0ABT6QGQ0_9PSED|nr:hypothetical protein [Pseudomonas sp. 681]MDI2590063.1 hypothetical protein [Pseudomonas sp. 681]
MSNNFLSCGFRSVFFLTLPLMGACSWAGQMAKDTAEDVTGYYGPEHFTLIATTPANFDLTSKAQYAPRAGQDCNVHVAALGGEVARHKQKTEQISAKETAQTESFTIPLEYHIAGCVMDLTRVSISVDGRYGPTSLDIGGDSGGITIRDMQEKTDLGDINFRGVCSWLFQMSVARIKKDGISKILSCSGADEQWKVPEDRFSKSKPGGSLNRRDLPGKVVHLEVRFSPDEQPTFESKWQKFPNGWKPCLGKGIDDPYGFCRGNTKDFRTFDMNGRKCTIYPGCTD